MSAVSSASEDEAYEALQCARARIEYLERHQKELIAQRDELLIAFKHIATQTGNMKFDAYQFSRSIIAKVEEKSNE